MEYYSALKRNKLLITYNLDESRMHYAELKKPDSKVYMVYDYIYEGKTMGAINRSEGARGRGTSGVGEDYTNAARGNFCGVLTVLYLD